MAGSATILRADARALPLADASVDAIVCDPPYELGFMGRSWDASGVAYDVDMWRGCLRVLKPGGYLLAFGGSRTWHRLTCAIEDAGFEIRDSMAWMYGSGFPKSLDVAKAIDKAAGAEREVIETRQQAVGFDPQRQGGGGWAAGEVLVTAPATDDARRWQGWGTALKPGFEPIVVARKPLAGTVAANVLQFGTGALNIDGCRVQMSAADRDRIERMGGYGPSGYERNSDTAAHFMQGTPIASASQAHDAGRWPTNVILSHQPLLDGDGEIVGDACADGCVPGCPVAELDAQSGITKRGDLKPYQRQSGDRVLAHGLDKAGAWKDYTRDGDSGGASRFFPTFRYEAKAPDHERPRVDGVAHPTVKPLELIRWLCRLVTQPGGRVLDMFSGSGTTLEAALLEGFDVVATENWEPYLPLIRYRLERAHRRKQPGITRLAVAKPPKRITGQGDLFAEILEGTA